MSINYRFVQPVDAVSIRGNKLFGDAGAFGESHFPPRPSVLSGAFRSALLAGAGNEIETFRNNQPLSDDALRDILGTPEKPGAFAITGVFPARKANGADVEIFLPMPADILVFSEGRTIRRMRPQELDKTILYSSIPNLPYVPILRQDKQTKPESGWLLNQAGIETYLNDRGLSHEHVEPRNMLWIQESRVGIGLKPESRTADEGKLFTVEHTVTKQPEHRTTGTSCMENRASGLVVSIAGCNGHLPAKGFVRLGGDGRAASFVGCAPTIAQAPTARINETRRFKLVLLNAGLFQQGWLPDSVDKHEGVYRLKLAGMSARLCCAAVPRAEVVSGWDLAKWEPKAAARVAPAGSVYWFDELEGDIAALDKLAIDGLWPQEMDNAMRSRWAEGYNRMLLAAW